MLNIVIAHLPEASGIIHAFALARSARHSGLYENQHIRLMLSGQGAESCRLTTTRLQKMASFSDLAANDYWLNFGIAGAGALDIGTVVAGKTVSNLETSRKWILNRPPSSAICSADIVTVAEPESVYSPDKVYDMESAGICEVLSSDMSTESSIARLVIIKVISDNIHHPPATLDKNRINAILNNAFDQIILIIRSIIESPE